MRRCQEEDARRVHGVGWQQTRYHDQGVFGLLVFFFEGLSMKQWFIFFLNFNDIFSVFFCLVGVFGFV